LLFLSDRSCIARFDPLRALFDKGVRPR
jgi:hypothetical protein